MTTRPAPFPPHVPADTRARRLVGLALRRPRRNAHGLLLDRCRSVHTCGMRYALDLAWFDAELALVRIDEAVPPWRLRGCKAARGVIELPAGGAARHGLRPGQRLVLAA